METPVLHPDLEPVRHLLGSWHGTGHGRYPTIEPFSYTEEVTFAHVGKPFLSYAQRTRAADDGRPLHSETGYWRVTALGPPATLEVTIAQPTGFAEVLLGTIDGARRIALRSDGVLRTPTAKEVSEVAWVLEWDEGVLRYELDMAAVGQPLQFHLEAELHRA